MTWYWWLLLGVLVGTGVFIGALSAWPLGDSGEWEQHPCSRPNHPHAEVGQIWKCKCGRRWEITSIKKWRTSRDMVWRERTPEIDLAEAEGRLEMLSPTNKETRQ